MKGVISNKKRIKKFSSSNYLNSGSGHALLTNKTNKLLKWKRDFFLSTQFNSVFYFIYIYIYIYIFHVYFLPHIFYIWVLNHLFNLCKISWFEFFIRKIEKYYFYLFIYFPTKEKPNLKREDSIPRVIYREKKMWNDHKIYFSNLYIFATCRR